jgi:hypothetical protein
MAGGSLIAPGGKPASDADEADTSPRAELTVFTAQPAYIYLPLPPAASYGHRAELWVGVLGSTSLFV